MSPQVKSASLRPLQSAKQFFAGMFRLHRVGYALIVQRQPYGAEPQAIGKLLKFVRKAEAFPFLFLFLELLLEALFRRLHILLVETLTKTFVVKRYQQFRVIAGAMQALPVIFYNQLPVAGFNDILLAGNFGLGQLVWSEVRSKPGAHLFDITRCGRGKANINKATDHSDLYRIQTEIFLGKAGKHTAGIQQLSGKVVRPVVVGTDEPPAVAFLPRNQFMAAVPAYIVKSMHLTAFRPLQKKGPRSDF